MVTRLVAAAVGTEFSGISHRTGRSPVDVGQQDGHSPEGSRINGIPQQHLQQPQVAVGLQRVVDAMGHRGEPPLQEPELVPHALRRVHVQRSSEPLRQLAQRHPVAAKLRTATMKTRR